jgi:WhiB family redox-sensing transcriptional regulator
VHRPATPSCLAAAVSAAEPAEPRPPALPCRADDPDLWFADSPAQLEQAKALCANCPIRRSCLAAALDRREPWGVWGGEIFDQGVVIERKRPRGRPRKAACA